MERVTVCFLRGRCLPSLCGGGGRGGENKLWDAAVAFECVPEKSLLCVLHHLISLCARQHHTLFSSFSPPLSTLSEWHLIRSYERLCTWHPCLCACGFVQVWSVRLIKVELSHLFIQMTLILVCLLALHLCVLTRQFRHKKSWAKTNYNSWDDLLSVTLEMQLKAAYT